MLMQRRESSYMVGVVGGGKGEGGRGKGEGGEKWVEISAYGGVSYHVVCILILPCLVRRLKYWEAGGLS